MSLLYIGFVLLVFVVLMVEIRNYQIAKKYYIQAKKDFEQLDRDLNRFL